MPENQTNSINDPKALLQTAIEELDLFTSADTSSLEVGEDGRLVASKEGRLKKVMGLARRFIGPLFSEQKRREKAKKREELKQAILHQRDIVQSHSALIAKYSEGDDAQRKLADYALSAIRRFNALVLLANSPARANHDDDKQRLLKDEAIQGKPIELPHRLSIRFDSHPDAHPVRQTFKKMGQTFLEIPDKKGTIPLSPKKTLQFMIDTFHMKAIRMIQTHVSMQSSVADIVAIVKGSPLEIDEESNPELISMQQLLEVSPGFFIFVTGAFKRNLADQKFLTLPRLDSIRLSFERTHCGFPYPSQHTGWALSDPWVQAFPLRSEQTPLFQKVDKRKKELAHHLLHDHPSIQKARKLAKLKRTAFDQNRAVFIPLFIQSQHALTQGFSLVDAAVLEEFVKEMERASSPFDLLAQTGEQIQNLFVTQPIAALEEEWLDAKPTPLRSGKPQDKFQAACERFGAYRQKAVAQLNPDNPIQAFVLQQGDLLGRAFQTIALQYQSEKMGFPPPLLNDFERKLQMCAFQQLIIFIDECESQIEQSETLMKEVLLKAWANDLELLQTSNIEDHPSLPLSIVDELEFYFNSRFFSASL